MHGCTTVYNEVQSPISAKSNTPPGRDKLTLQLDGGKAQPRLRTRHRSSVDVSDSGKRSKGSRTARPQTNAPGDMRDCGLIKCYVPIPRGSFSVALSKPMEPIVDL
uniref:Uncharacterized protein n=1 Tax=Anopheles coluzzii TaxID=1518534 RepID=A0A8W7P7B0_ANOCL